MGVKWLLQLYYNYALLTGVTSYRWVTGSYRQTWLTQSYALLLNILQLVTLPYAFWLSSQYIEEIKFFPNLIWFTTYILYSVSYVAIAYAQISRGSRDKALVKVERIVSRLKREKDMEISTGKHIEGGSLRFMFYLKLGTMIYLCMSSMASCLVMPNETKWIVLLCGFFFSNAMNIPIVASNRYFLALWDIASCYQYINRQLEHIMSRARSRYPTHVELKELHRLWSLHAVLGRCTMRMNQIYGILLLTARFENLAFSVINGYWGMIFTFSMETPLVFILYGAVNYITRLLDFYLLNYMCDLTVQYQSAAHHAVSEGYWFKELNAYLLYARSSKMSLWVCGLYKLNGRCWFQMLGSIINLFVLLLQFHLLRSKKYTLHTNYKFNQLST